MAAERLPHIVIRTFEHYYEQLAQGQTGLIPESEIRPVETLPDLEQLPPSLAEAGRGAAGEGGAAQAERRAGHGHGAGEGQVAADRARRQEARP